MVRCSTITDPSNLLFPVPEMCIENGETDVLSIGELLTSVKKNSDPENIGREIRRGNFKISNGKNSQMTYR